ncbi:sigma factor [Mycobacterium sp. 48b]|uniref:sigma factor n=1 Tax=Mycobacterium sp. 48b TaxID=3400426 RepID=UPI003AB0563C
MPTTDDLELALDVFLTHRTRLFGIAYRVTGELSVAEDLVQEAWLRWQRTDRAKVQNPAAFLTTTTTNLAINVIQSARHRRESPTASPLTYLMESDEDQPTLHAEQTAVVEQMLVLLMARLTHGELAAYLLRKGFEYAYVDLADLLRTSVANARQLVRRAQTRLEAGQRTSAVLAMDHRRLTTAFLVAVRSGDLQHLERLLVPDRVGSSAA